MADPATSFNLRPIDDAARDGRFHLLFGGPGYYACARWSDSGWVFSSGIPLDFVPDQYHAHTATENRHGSN